MGAMRCATAGNEHSLCRLAERPLAVRAALARPGTQDKAVAVALTMKHLCFRYLDEQLAQELERSGGSAGEEAGQGGKNQAAHLLRSAAAWRQRRAPARMRAVFDSAGLPRARPEEQTHI